MGIAGRCGMRNREVLARSHAGVSYSTQLAGRSAKRRHSEHRRVISITPGCGTGNTALLGRLHEHAVLGEHRRVASIASGGGLGNSAMQDRLRGACVAHTPPRHAVAHGRGPVVAPRCTVDAPKSRARAPDEARHRATPSSSARNGPRSLGHLTECAVDGLPEARSDTGAARSRGTGRGPPRRAPLRHPRRS